MKIIWKFLNIILFISHNLYIYILHCNYIHMNSEFILQNKLHLKNIIFRKADKIEKHLTRRTRR